MSVKQFEVFHGIVLTKLMRSKKPVALRMVETKPTEDWRVYTFNLYYDLFVKHRSAPNPNAAKRGASWQFTFSPSEVSRILSKDRDVYVALVCGQQNVEDEMDVCFLDPKDVEKIFPTDSSKTFSLTVRRAPRKGLKVKKINIPRNAIEKWDIPGS